MNRSIFIKIIIAFIIVNSQLLTLNSEDKPYLRINTKMHTAPVRRISVDTAGKYLLSCSPDKTAILWDAESGAYIKTFRIPIGDDNEGMLYSCAISPDGLYVALGGWTSKDGLNNNLYIFNTNSGEMVKRVSGFPDVLFDIEFSMDGKYLAASLKGGEGVFIIQTGDWSVYKKLTGYGAASYNSSFAKTGNLATVCDDGKARLYDSSFNLIKEITTTGGEEPYDVAFSPDGRKIAVGYYDSARVQVFDGQTLALLFEADNTGIPTDENIESIAWSKNGDYLYAGGKYSLYKNGGWWRQLRVWSDAGRGSYTDINGSYDTITDIKVRNDNTILIGGCQPDIMRTNRDGEELFYNRGEILSFRNGNRFDYFKINQNGTKVGFKPQDDNSYIFDITEKSLIQSDSDGELPITERGNITITDWEDSYSPKINGNSASFLKKYEETLSAVVSNNGQFALFGADWDIYCLDSAGKIIWEKPVPGAAWAVNISGDDKLVVATLGDGTIRWYNATDGKELLALFVHSATKKWVMWTPEGYFDHSPGGEQLVGYHINRGYDKEATFLPVDKFYDTYYRPDIILASIEGKDISAIAKNDINKGIKLPPEITIITKTVVDGNERGRKLILRKADFTFDYDNIAADLKAVDQGGGIKRIRFYLNDKIIVEDDNITIKSGVFERSYQITLQSGFNVLKAVGYSEDGTESNGFVITYQVNKKVVDKPNMYIVGIGINKYKNSQYNLSFCIPDVDGFISAISPKSQKLFNNVIVSKIYDNEANKANILAQFNDLKSKIKPEDVFIMYYSGHGVALAIDDVNTEFFYVLHNVVQMTNLNFANKEAISGTELRGLLKDIKATKQVVFVDACNSGAFTDLFAMKGAAEENALAKLSKASGTVIFASTNADQFATEFHVLGHGIFTYTLLDGLLDDKVAKSNGQITVSSLNDFLYEQFPVFTKKYKGSEQYPKTFIFGQDFPIGIK